MRKNKSKKASGHRFISIGLKNCKTTPCRHVRIHGKPRTRSRTGRRVYVIFFSFGSAILRAVNDDRRPGTRSTALKQHGGARRDHTVSGDPQPAGGTFCSRRRVRHRSIAATRHREQRRRRRRRPDRGGGLRGETRRPAERPEGLLLRGRIGSRNDSRGGPSVSCRPCTARREPDGGTGWKGEAGDGNEARCVLANKGDRRLGSTMRFVRQTFPWIYIFC